MALGEPVLDEAAPHAVLLVARQNGHWGEAECDDIQRWIEGHEAEQDVPDDAAFVFRDERHRRPPGFAQLLDEVRLGRGPECSFVHAAYGRDVAGLLGADLDHGIPGRFRMESAQV